MRFVRIGEFQDHILNPNPANMLLLSILLAFSSLGKYVNGQEEQVNMTAFAGGVVTQNKALIWNNEPGDPHLYRARNTVQCFSNEILQYSNVEAHTTFMEPDIKTGQESEQPYVLPLNSVSTDLPPRVTWFTVNFTGAAPANQQKSYNLSLVAYPAPSLPPATQIDPGKGYFWDLSQQNTTVAFFSPNNLVVFFACDPYATDSFDMQECDRYHFYKNNKQFLGYGEYMAKVYGGKVPVGDSRASVFSYYKQNLYANIYVHSMQNEDLKFDNYTVKSTEMTSSLDGNGGFAAEIRFPKTNPNYQKYFKSFELQGGTDARFYIYYDLPEITNSTDMPQSNITLFVDSQNATSLVNYSLTEPFYTFVAVGGIANFELGPPTDFGSSTSTVSPNGLAFTSYSLLHSALMLIISIIIYQ
ncbi:hypothetical protein WR25_26548 [Diploscapter pachys]|uniref:CUB-like domain-containing protein n=1 Tax=Diploscapter pachys TaxID=2018661 RepID=A0A2A2LIU8_9BILA|nr:hypothetical protein WR25_26548 [Diploscapter pachys]